MVCSLFLLVPVCLVAGRRRGSAVGPNVVNVDCGTDNDNVSHIELRCLCQDLSVDTDHRATVPVQATVITAALVSIQIDAATLAGGMDHQFETGVELPQLLMGATAVANDFNTL